MLGRKVEEKIFGSLGSFRRSRWKSDAIRLLIRHADLAGLNGALDTDMAVSDASDGRSPSPSPSPTVMVSTLRCATNGRCTAMQSGAGTMQCKQSTNGVRFRHPPLGARLRSDGCLLEGRPPARITKNTFIDIYVVLTRTCLAV